MQAMAWWSVPLVAFILAIVWVSVANRPRPPADPHDSVAEHERFIEALERPIGDTGPAATSPDPDADDPEASGPRGPAGPTGQPA
jgi:hypothetical protein